jgi:hypothetical protein
MFSSPLNAAMIRNSIWDRQTQGIVLVSCHKRFSYLSPLSVRSGCSASLDYWAQSTRCGHRLHIIRMNTTGDFVYLFGKAST